ncbi:hypothetical protein FRB94_004338 [Tulasnella sp. JGI-2019a]|nr:hypothetical protein FRB94_004338 [Tulasnella sp. JGI-2019a]
MSAGARNILRQALPLIPNHGFTRKCLSEAASSMPGGPKFGDTEITALFGEGNAARRTLFQAWLQEGLNNMGVTSTSSAGGSKLAVADLLKGRLRYNEPVIGYLPEAAAMLAVTNVPLLFDPRPAVMHVSEIADQALHLSGDVSRGTQWYTRRGGLALAYAAAELHQMQSPETAPAFLTRLLEDAQYMEDAVGNAVQFGGFFLNSWKGIIKSRGIY